MTTQEAHDAGVRRALANVRRKADDLIAAVIDAEQAMDGERPPLALADHDLTTEQMVTAASMERGGWVQWPGYNRWWKVDDVATRPGNKQMVIHYVAIGGDVIGRSVETYETFAYMTADQMVAHEAKQAAA